MLFNSTGRVLFRMVETLQYEKILTVLDQLMDRAKI
jgi:hypothetical protein